LKIESKLNGWLQVAAFCGTSMAAELLLAAKLPIGSSQQQSELLLQQTQEAADAQLEVTGAGSQA
jgi:DNA mismatch repair protein MutS2